MGNNYLINTKHLTVNISFQWFIGLGLYLKLNVYGSRILMCDIALPLCSINVELIDRDTKSLYNLAYDLYEYMRYHRYMWVKILSSKLFR